MKCQNFSLRDVQKARASRQPPGSGSKNGNGHLRLKFSAVASVVVVVTDWAYRTEQGSWHQSLLQKKAPEADRLCAPIVLSSGHVSDA